jgi:Fic family protein
MPARLGPYAGQTHGRPRTAIVEKRYLTTNPWLRFGLDLTRSGAEFWLGLGEARGKVEHLTQSLLKPEVAAEMNRVALANGAQALAALDFPRAEKHLIRETQNVVSACNSIADDLLAHGAPLTPERIEALNAIVVSGLDVPEVGEPGPYPGAPYEECEYLLAQLCDWLASPDFAPAAREWEIPLALLKAIIAHLYLVWIRPFRVGNGRTARLVELRILLAAGVPVPAAHLLGTHYNDTRVAYFEHLDDATSSGGDVLPFLRYAVRGFVDGISTQLDRVWAEQYDDRWEQFVYERFGETHTAAKERQRRLALELSKESGPVARRDLPRLTEELDEAYQGTERMLSRDLNYLERLGLVKRERHGWRPRREVILAFPPLRRL